jgi:hypothetical protein
MISPSRLSYEAHQAHQAHLSDIRRRTAERPGSQRVRKTTIRARLAVLLQKPPAPASAQFHARPARLSQ